MDDPSVDDVEELKIKAIIGFDGWIFKVNTQYEDQYNYSFRRYKQWSDSSPQWQIRVISFGQ